MRLTIDRLGHRGDGIAPGPVYVAGALPGEVVVGETAGDRMEAPRIVSPGADRVVPACPHYADCGGCQLMHAADPFVGRWKVEVVRRALAAQGLPAPIRGIATSPERSRRRATLSGRRVGSGAVVGFHARRSDAVSPIAACRVLVPGLVAALPAMERLTVAAASRRGEVRICATQGPRGLDVALSDGLRRDAGTRTELVRIAGEADLARLSVDGEPVLLARPPALRPGGVAVVPPPGAFVQATAEGEAALLACVSQAVGDAGCVVDLFSGCGTFALPLSRRAAVHAVEGAAAMTEAATVAARHCRGHRPLTTETRDLFRDPVPAVELNRFDAAIIDPPRAGAVAQTHQIAGSAIARVAAVSCNPASFARDAAILVAGGFRLDWIRVVDQFRWSTHVELAAAFHRG